MTETMNKPVTRAIMLQTLCAPCFNYCRYCLLSWNGQIIGASWDRSAAYAKRFYDWVRQARPELKFDFSFGSSMEHPKLIEAIDFMNSIDSVMGKFLQLDGMKMRTDDELEVLYSSIAAHGVQSVDFTFYGTEAYHDRFAARKEDYDLMIRSIRFALAAGIVVLADIPLTGDNIGMVDPLVDDLRKNGCTDIRFRIPHGEGRGELIEPIRLKKHEFDALSDELKTHLNRSAFRTEGEWLVLAESGELKIEENRTLLISLTEENIERIENTPFDELIAEVEALDETHYSAFPSFAELLKTYGDRDGERLFSYRDLFHFYRKRYALEHGVKVYDVTDERQSGSRRY